jgi:sarcosine oxidase delta subunit
VPGRYFKVKKRIGFMFGSRTYTCPYCGNEADPDEFHTQDQIEYARSVAVRQFEEEVYRSLKKMEFDVRPPSRAALGIGMSLKVSRSSDAHPIHHYREKRLETEIACDRCGLRYTIYGVFGYCPECGSHNSLVIFEANLQLAEKMLALAAEQADAAMQVKLVESALMNCVSAFDGWGRATAAAFAQKATDPEKVKTVSFQNINKAADHVQKHFGLDLRGLLPGEEFDRVVALFQMRHVVAHKMGVVDEEYVKAVDASASLVGRKLSILADDLRAVMPLLKQMAEGLLRHLEGMK